MTEPAASPDALAALAVAALPRFGIAAASPVAVIHARENVIVRVDDPASPAPWVLRIHRPGYRDAAEIRSELAWMRALADAGIATPPVRDGVDGDPVQEIEARGIGRRCVDVLGWVPGRPLADDDPDEAYHLLGRTSARIQRHAAAWRRPAGFRRPRLDVDGLVGPRAVWGDYADLPGLDPAQRALMDRAAAVVRRRLAAFGEAPDRFGLTHGDLMPDNVLIEEGVPTVIDFDDCGTGWYLYDLATLLAMRVADPDADRVRDAWLAGYRTVWPVPAEHAAEIDTLVMARMLLGLGWMHTRRDTEMAQQLTGMAIAMSVIQAERLLAREGA